MSAISRFARWINDLNRLVCRHPEGTICPHRQYDYDRWYRGYLDGLTAGERRVEAHWRGNVYGTGPYAGYPAPSLGPEPALVVDAAKHWTQAWQQHRRNVLFTHPDAQDCWPENCAADIAREYAALTSEPRAAAPQTGDEG